MKKLISILIIVAAVAGGYTAYVNYSRAGHGANPMVAQDLATIQDPKAEPDAFYRAMLRLGHDLNPAVKDAAKTRLKMENPMYRAASYEALGFFPDRDSLEIIKNGLTDSDRIVRHATIRGLARQVTDERVKLIVERLNDKTVSSEDKLELYTTLSRIGGKNEIASSVEWLIHAANSGNELDSSEAVLRVASIAPTDPKVVQLLKSKLKSRDPKILAFSIRHLSSIGDTQVIHELHNYAQDPSPEIRAAAVQSIALSCAPDRWETYEGMLKREKDKQVLQAIVRAPTIVLGDRSVTFLQDLISNSTLPQDLLDLAKSLLPEVEKNRNNGRCEKKKAQNS